MRKASSMSHVCRSARCGMFKANVFGRGEGSRSLHGGCLLVLIELSFPVSLLAEISSCSFAFPSLQILLNARNLIAGNLVGIFAKEQM